MRHQDAIHPDASSAATSFKSVCYKCRYKTSEATAGNKCPNCGFPLIHQPRAKKSIKLDLRQIFDRTSVNIGVGVGAPPLPGLGEGTGVGLERPDPAAFHPSGYYPMTPAAAPTQTRGRVGRLGVAVVLCSAVALGVVAAMVQSGL
ncbi:MAG: hypothetical protein AAGC55_06190 [Myxococcota bacterium]